MGEVAELGLKRSINFDFTLIEKSKRLIIGNLGVHPCVVMLIRDFRTLDLPITGHGCHPEGCEVLESCMMRRHVSAGV